MIRHLLILEKMNFFKFLKGDEAYKHDWTCKKRQRYALYSYRKNTLGKAMDFLDRKILPWARRQWFVDRAKCKLAHLMGGDG